MKNRLLELCNTNITTEEKFSPQNAKTRWLIHVLEKPDETPRDETRKFSHLREYLKGLSEAFLEPGVYFCCPSFRKTLQKC